MISFDTDFRTTFPIVIVFLVVLIKILKFNYLIYFDINQSRQVFGCALFWDM